MPHPNPPFRPGVSIGKLMIAIALAAIGLGLFVSATRPPEDAPLLLVAWSYTMIAMPMLLLSRIDRDVAPQWRRFAVVVACLWLSMAFVIPCVMVFLVF